MTKTRIAVGLVFAALIAALIVSLVALTGTEAKHTVYVHGSTPTTALRPYNPFGGKAYALTTICDPQCTTTLDVGK